MEYQKENENQLNSFFADGIAWRLRGIGLGAGISLVTGREIQMATPDMSGFVDSRENGLLLVQLFKGRAYLDYRPTEPNWIQVKVCVESCYKPYLEHLMNAVQKNNGRIEPYLLESSFEKMHAAMSLTATH